MKVKVSVAQGEKNAARVFARNINTGQDVKDQQLQPGKDLELEVSSTERLVIEMGEEQPEAAQASTAEKASG